MLVNRSTPDCTEVTPDCPVSGSIYGYAPNIAASYAFAISFGLCALIQFIQMLKWRMWSFGIAVILGAISEVIGEYNTPTDTHKAYTEMKPQI
jgi:hypothetical protein